MSAHPAYAQLVGFYRLARGYWRDYPAMREVAVEIGMTERSYCDASVASHKALWSAIGGADPLTVEHFDRAFAEARL